MAVQMPLVQLAVRRPGCPHPAQEAGSSPAGWPGRWPPDPVPVSPMASARDPGTHIVLLLQPDLASLRDPGRNLASDKGPCSRRST